jgi:hypothetical protein
MAGGLSFFGRMMGKDFYHREHREHGEGLFRSMEEGRKNSEVE